MDLFTDTNIFEYVCVRFSGQDDTRGSEYAHGKDNLGRGHAHRQRENHITAFDTQLGDVRDFDEHNSLSGAGNRWDDASAVGKDKHDECETENKTNEKKYNNFVPSAASCLWTR